MTFTKGMLRFLKPPPYHFEIDFCIGEQHLRFIANRLFIFEISKHPHRFPKNIHLYKNGEKLQ